MKDSIGIIGAGITGLTLARFLYERGISFRLYEKAESVGGVMQSYREGEWLAESGPNTFLVKSPKVESFLQQTSLAQQRIFASDTAQKRYIVRDGILHPLPAGPLSFLTSDLFSFSAKLQLLKEPFVSSLTEGEDESVASFVRRRLGSEFLDYAINPFVAGIQAGDPKKLSIQQSFKRMYDLEQQYGSLIWGMIRGRKKRQKRDQSLPDENRIFSFPDGMGQLAEELAAPLDDELQLGNTVTAVEKAENGGWSLETEQNGDRRTMHHDHVICTAPLYRLTKMSLNIDKSNLLKTLGKVYYPPLSVWTFGFKRSHIDHPLDGFGMLMPEVENRNILGTLFSSSCFPARAPDGSATLTTFVGGARQPNIPRKPEEEQRELILSDLHDLLGINEEPIFQHVVPWEHAIPQYELGYETVKEALNKLEKANPGLYFTGNFRSGASIDKCMRAGLEMAEKLINAP